MTLKTLKADIAPYFAIFIGLALSILIWYALDGVQIGPIYHLDLGHYAQKVIILNDCYRWILLFFGIVFSFYIGNLLNNLHLAQKQIHTLLHHNEHLKNEIITKEQTDHSKKKFEIALMQGQKLQAIGTLAGGIAHDFNNILYAIKGYAEMAVEDVNKETITHRNLLKVLDATKKGRDLVSRIMAFSRKQHHEMMPLDLSIVIEEALSLLRPTIPASVILTFHPLKTAPILGNQTLLHQVLINIINNAIDAMDGEGQIVINMKIADDCQTIQQTPKSPSENKDIQLHYYEIKITDTGRGMSASAVGRIFEPFFTTKEVGKGTGLGLSMVHTIIQEHRGEVRVESKLGEGTSFILLLPKYYSENKHASKTLHGELDLKTKGNEYYG